MATKLTNTNIDPMPLPFPFRGVLAGKQAVIVNTTVALCLAALGGTAWEGKGLEVKEVADLSSYPDDFYRGDVGGTAAVIALPATLVPFGDVSNVLTTDADLNYVASTDTLNAGANVALKNGSGASRTMGVDAGTALAATLVGAALTVPAGTGGVASAGAAGGVGGAQTVRGGVGGAGSAGQLAGAGGALTLKGGDAGAANTGSGGAGGAASLDAGAATGAGTNGTVAVGGTNAESVAIGRAGKVTSLLGLTKLVSLTTAERDALSPQPAAGTVIYNSTTNKLNVRVAAAWEAITSA